MAERCSETQFHQDYILALRKYEDHLEKVGPGGRVRNVAEKCCPPTIVEVGHEQGMSADMHLGVFWPRGFFEAKEGRKLTKRELVSYEFQGRRLVGCIREESCGKPIGSINLTKNDRRYIKKVMEVGNSENSHRAGQLDDIFEKGSSALTGVDVKETPAKVSKPGGEDGETLLVPSVRVKRTGRTLEEHPSDDSGDWTKLLAPSLGDATGGGIPTDDADDDDDETGNADDSTPNKGKRAAASSGADGSSKKARGAGPSSSKRLRSGSPKAAEHTRKAAKPARQAKVFPSTQSRDTNTTQAVFKQIRGRYTHKYTQRNNTKHPR